MITIFLIRLDQKCPKWIKLDQISDIANILHLVDFCLSRPGHPQGMKIRKEGMCFKKGLGMKHDKTGRFHFDIVTLRSIYSND